MLTKTSQKERENRMITYVYHNLGLGDHIVCNGLVREIARKSDVRLFVKHHNRSSVKLMYDDTHMVSLVPVESDRDVEAHLDALDENKVDVIRAGCSSIKWKRLQENDYTFDEAMYACAKVDFEKRWDLFYYPNDGNRIPRTAMRPYVFIHDDDRYPIMPRYHIQLTEAYGNRSIVRPKASDGLPIHDYIQALQSAEEVHVIDSVFLFLADSIPTKGELFLHRYARKLTPFEIPTLRKNWNILT